MLKPIINDATEVQRRRGEPKPPWLAETFAEAEIAMFDGWIVYGYNWAIADDGSLYVVRSPSGIEDDNMRASENSINE
jgi:hypothetical protein